MADQLIRARFADLWEKLVDFGDGSHGLKVASVLAGNGSTTIGEAHIGEVGAPGDVVNFTPTLDTNPYGDGDLLFDFAELTNFVRVVGGRAIVQSITVIDKADQKIAMDLFSSPVTIDMGTANSAPSISDADAALGVQNIRAAGKTYSIETTDYKDLGGVSVATVTGVGLVIEADAASRSIFLAGMIRGTPTYAADSLVFRFGLLWF